MTERFDYPFELTCTSAAALRAAAAAPKSESAYRLLEEVVRAALMPTVPGQLLVMAASQADALQARADDLARRLESAQPDDDLAAQFDRVFAIRRTESPDGVLIGLVQAILAAVRLAAHPKTPSAQKAALARGLAKLAKLNLHGPLPASRLIVGELIDPVKALSPRAQWKAGHHVFVPLIQALISILDRIAAALASGDNAGACEALNDGSDLFHAAAAVLEMTGRMKRSAYDAIRKLMSPPLGPPNFSGTNLADHRLLLIRMTSMKTLWQHDSPPVQQALNHFWIAWNATWYAHVSVCEKVAGAVGSLATAGNAGARPAARVLGDFATRALQRVGLSKDTATERPAPAALAPPHEPTPRKASGAPPYIASELVTVVERIPLQSAFATPRGAQEAGQAYDNAAGMNAHQAEGHTGHAAFFFEPSEGGGFLVVLYPWADRRSAERLFETEATVLADWFARYAAGPRQIGVLDELDVETDAIEIGQAHDGAADGAESAQ
jgi:hypothetical protein